MFAVALSMLLLAAETTPAPVADAPAQAAPAATVGADKAEKAEKKICKRESSTESRLGSKRICLTAEQWKAAQQSAERGRR